MHSPYLLIKQYLSTFHRSVKVLDSVYAGLLAHGSSPEVHLPGIMPVAALAQDLSSPFTVAGPRRTQTCFPLSFRFTKEHKLLFNNSILHVAKMLVNPS